DEVLAAAPALRIVSNYAVGYDNIDVPAATRRGIAVTNTPGVLTAATADLTWALILATTRRVVEADAFMRAGRYTSWDPLLLLGGDLAGRRLGIVGFGRIGQAVAQRARGFELEVVFTSRSPKPEAAARLGARQVELDELLASSDIVSLHCALTAETRHLIDARRIAMMKPSAYLINTARGPVVHEADLVAALRSDQIAGAGLDVYEAEPLMSPGLAELPNVVVVPHIGSATHETRTKMADIAVDNILALFAGRRPAHLVDPSVALGL
ncbi:MAG TPA: D-glycerate dehydrogenase, partial [Limnochordia bacterium]|nr:D-glycerate dehydrogenase [Limnochordia bacterium]